MTTRDGLLTNLTVGLAALVAGLVAAIVFVALTPVDITQHDVISQAEVPRDRVVLAVLPPRPEMTETVTRPLFEASRRPRPAPVDVAQSSGTPAAEGQPDLELRGIMRVGGTMKALIRSGQTPDGVWLSQGVDREGLLFRDIEGDVVIVEARGQRYGLPLTYRARTKDISAAAQ